MVADSLDLELLRVSIHNFKAVAQYQSGDFLGAQTTLTAALAVAIEICARGGINCYKDEKIRCYGEAMDRYSSVPSNFYSLSPFNNIESSYEFEGIYNSAFLLTNDIPVLARETTAVLLFNLALIHHRFGVKNNDHRELCNSLHIYKLSLDLLGGFPSKKSESIMLGVVIAALYNNMAQIFESLFLVDEAKAFLTNLEEIINDLEKVDILIKDDDFLLFQCNVYFAKMHGFSVAPAA